MIRRMIALLLALMLLPAAALADAFRFDVKIDLNEENAVTILKEMGVFAGAKNEDDLCAAMVDFIDGTCITMISQDDAFMMDFVIGGEKLFDFSILTGGEDVIFTSDLMDGAGLSIPVKEVDLENDAFIRMMEDTDWMSLLAGMGMAALEKIDAVEGVTTHGSFSGDAYTGGVTCVTYTFDDAAIAGILDALLTDDFRDLIVKSGKYWGFDGEALLAELDGVNAKAAEANEHRYIVRFVSDAEDNPIGMSISVIKGDQQLATLSMGVEENALRIVVGFGLDEVNYWHSHEITYSITEGEDGVLTVSAAGKLVEFTAPKDNDFSYASATVKQTMLKSDWNAEMTVQKAGLSWRFNNTQQLANMPENSTAVQGLYLPGTRFVNKSAYAINGKEYMTETVTAGPCDPIPSDGAGLKLVELGGDEANDLAGSVGMELAQRLLNAIPMTLLLYLQ